jgi:hypothetical protein
MEDWIRKHQQPGGTNFREDARLPLLQQNTNVNHSNSKKLYKILDPSNNYQGYYNLNIEQNNTDVQTSMKDLFSSRIFQVVTGITILIYLMIIYCLFVYK